MSKGITLQRRSRGVTGKLALRFEAFLPEACRLRVVVRQQLLVDDRIPYTSSGIPTLVDFGATGCRPCDMMTPILASH